MYLSERLLPESARSAATRQPPTIDLGTAPGPWMLEILTRIDPEGWLLQKTSRRVEQFKHVLARSKARWLLASVLFPALQQQPNLQELAGQNEDPNFIHITAYILYIDASVRHEIVFKLLPSTQAKLVRIHRSLCLAHEETVPSVGVDKETCYRDLNEAFARVIDAAIFQASISELQNVEEDGSGELLAGRPETVKRAILEMMFRFLPPGDSAPASSASILTIYSKPTPLMGALALSHSPVACRPDNEDKTCTSTSHITDLHGVEDE